jgi:hypothetical protein
MTMEVYAKATEKAKREAIAALPDFVPLALPAPIPVQKEPEKSPRRKRQTQPP